MRICSRFLTSFGMTTATGTSYAAATVETWHATSLQDHTKNRHSEGAKRLRNLKQITIVQAYSIRPCPNEKNTNL
jgi:hypothetical protein